MIIHLELDCAYSFLPKLGPKMEMKRLLSFLKSFVQLYTHLRSGKLIPCDSVVVDITRRVMFWFRWNLDVTLGQTEAKCEGLLIMLNIFRKGGLSCSAWSLLTLLADVMAIRNSIFMVRIWRQQVGMGSNGFPITFESTSDRLHEEMGDWTGGN